LCHRGFQDFLALMRPSGRLTIQAGQLQQNVPIDAARFAAPSQ
jgi:hypothetical protein